jgi:hypothetical protein
MLDFRQQTRAKSKFPEPAENELLSINKANVKPMLSLVGVGVGGEAVNNKEDSLKLYNRMEQEVRELYGRPAGSVLNFAESAALTAICRRQDPSAELVALQSLKKRDPDFFPKSLDSLLRKWDATLDRAREKKATTHQSCIAPPPGPQPCYKGGNL